MDKGNFTVPVDIEYLGALQHCARSALELRQAQDRLMGDMLNKCKREKVGELRMVLDDALAELGTYEE